MTSLKEAVVLAVGVARQNEHMVILMRNLVNQRAIDQQRIEFLEEKTTKLENSLYKLMNS